MLPQNNLHEYTELMGVPHFWLNFYFLYDIKVFLYVLYIFYLYVKHKKMKFDIIFSRNKKTLKKLVKLFLFSLSTKLIFRICWSQICQNFEFLTKFKVSPIITIFNLAQINIDFGQIRNQSDALFFNRNQCKNYTNINFLHWF